MVGVRTPVVEATLERRVLIVYRLDADAASYLVPAPFTLQLVGGHAVGMLTLDRVTGLRPRGFPLAVGYSSENAAHRIAVEWDEGGRAASGTFVLARHTDSRMTRMFGDRFFPGAQERAEFEVAEDAPRLQITVSSSERERVVNVAVAATNGEFESGLFGSSAEVWRFFRRGGLSYSLRRGGGLLDGLDQRMGAAIVAPASIEFVESSIFTPSLGVADSAVVMLDIVTEWHAMPPP